MGKSNLGASSLQQISPDALMGHLARVVILGGTDRYTKSEPTARTCQMGPGNY